MANEAKTSIIFRELLREAKYYDDVDTIVEEQKSDNAKIDKLMKNASKRGNRNGFPDFIIYSKKYTVKKFLMFNLMNMSGFIGVGEENEDEDL